jgi:hypothetical protein
VTAPEPPEPPQPKQTGPNQNGPNQTGPERTTGARGPSRALVLAGIIAGGLAAFGASGRTWREGNGGIDPVTGMASHASVAGTAIAPGVRACALAVLAGVVALLLVRGRVRVVVAGALTVVAGIATALATRTLVGVPAHLSDTAWVWLSIAACLLATVSGVAAVLTCRGWNSTRSGRYESPGTRREDTEDPWQALDRGEDPTL